MQAELAALQRMRSGVPTMEQYVGRNFPMFRQVPEHLQVLYDLFNRSRYEQVFATVSMPPRHGKTTTFKLGLSYRVAYDPACQNFYATFGGDLAEEVGSETRKLVTRVGIKLERGKIVDWKTPHGGGLKSTSVGGSITGRGANGGIIVVDDSVKGMKVANSKSERDGIWQWLRSDVFSRLEGGGSIIVCNTRWHEDDPIGRLQEDGLGYAWQHINLPAVHDGFFNPIDEREHPEKARPLWTGIDAMHPTNEGAMGWYATKRRAGEYEWWSLYQGVPRSKERRIFELDPPRFELPLDWDGKRGCITLDPAATEKTSADHSALGAFAINGWGDASRMWVRKMARMQSTIPKVARMALTYQRIFRLPVVVESASGFKAIPQMLREVAPKIALHEITPLGDKLTRSLPVSKAWQRGDVWVPIGQDEDEELERRLREVYAQICKEQNVRPEDAMYPVIDSFSGWIDPYLREMKKFSGVGDAEDDQVDCTAHAWNTLYREKPIDKQAYYEEVY